MKKKRRRSLLVLVLALGLGLSLYFFKPGTSKKIAKLQFHKEVKEDIVNAGPLGQNVVLWDGDFLSIYDQEGKRKARVDRSRENLKLFIGRDQVYFYRPGDQNLEILDKNGRNEVDLTLEEGIFQVQEEEGQTLVHCKGENYETLYLVQGKDLVQIFKTDNFILHFHVLGPEDFAVSELSTSAAGYKTRLYIKNQKMESMDFPNQVSIGLFKDKDRVYLATEQKLIAVKDGESQEVDIPLASGLVYKKGKIYLLHSGIISSYNKKLEEEKKDILSMNAEDFFDNEGSLYATAGGEVAGNLTTKGAFYQALGKEMDKTKVQGDLVVSYQNRQIWVHKLVKE